MLLPVLVVLNRSTRSLEVPKGRLERLLTLLKHSLASLEVVTHALRLLGLGRDIRDLVIRHVTDKDGGDSVGGEVAEKVALDNLLGHGTHEVLDFFLLHS